MVDEAMFSFKEDEWVLPELRDFFSYPETRKKIAEIASRYKLNEKQTDVLFGGLRQVVKGEIEVEDLARGLVADSGLSFEAALDVQGDLLIDLLDGVDAQLEEQAVIYREMHPEDFLPPPPEEVDVSEEIARKVIDKTGFAPADPVLRRRFESIVVSRLKDARDEAETRAMMEKPTKTGGLGLTPEQSAAAVLLVSEAIPKVAEARDEAQKKKEEHGELLRQAEETKVRRGRELAARLNIVIPSGETAVEPAVPAPVMTKADLGLDTAKDEKEAKALEEQLPKKIVAEEVTEKASAMDAMVNDAVAATAVTLPDNDMKRRFRTLVTLYFRDLRDALETKSKFTMPAASGGMGMADAEAERVMAVLKEKMKGFSDAAQGRVAESKAKFVSAQAAKQLEGQAEGERKEQEALDRQYKGLLEKTGVSAPAGAQRMTPPGPPKIVPVSGGPSKDQPAAATPQAVSAPRAPSPAPVPTAAAPATKPAPTVVAPPPAAPTVPAPPTGVTRPTVADVKFVPKLIGPVEELRALTVKDFRRLSKEPREATLKIKDKIDLLEDQGFERKTDAIRAWQDSEVNKLYLETLRKSLEGKPVTEVIAERELAGEPTLNKAEFDAIMELNRKLRFG